MTYAASGVGVRIGGATLLDDVSIEVRPGEIVAVAGLKCPSFALDKPPARPPYDKNHFVGAWGTRMGRSWGTL